MIATEEIYRLTTGNRLMIASVLVPVSGPVEALAMAVTGRPAALPDLRGPGVAVLTERLRRARLP